MGQQQTQATELRLILDDYWPANVNRTGGHHWRRVKQEKDRAYQHVAAAYLNSQPRVVFEGKVTVEIVREWGHRQRAMDKDNLYSAAKFLVDAIREANRDAETRRLAIIGDDTEEEIDLQVHQRASEEKDANGRRKLRTILSIHGEARDVVPE